MGYKVTGCARRDLQVPEVVLRLSFYGRVIVREASLFCDESGGQGLETEWYLVTFVLHDQSIGITENIDRYERALLSRNLERLPFHSEPLFNGHDEYRNMDLAERKAYFSTFMTFLQHLPVRYHTFAYRVSEFADQDALAAKLRRDMVNFFFDNLSHFQHFDCIKVYYDNAQGVVTQSLHDAIEYALFKGSVLYRKTDARDYYLSQTADLICWVELTALKCTESGMSPTGNRFFGSIGPFKRNYLKKIRTKRL